MRLSFEIKKRVLKLDLQIASSHSSNFLKKIVKKTRASASFNNQKILEFHPKHFKGTVSDDFRLLFFFVKKYPWVRAMLHSAELTKKFYQRLCAMQLSVTSKSNNFLVESALFGTVRELTLRYAAYCEGSHTFANISANSQPYAQII
jgi:hypothetical protein